MCVCVCVYEGWNMIPFVMCMAGGQFHVLSLFSRSKTKRLSSWKLRWYQYSNLDEEKLPWKSSLLTTFTAFRLPTRCCGGCRFPTEKSLISKRRTINAQTQISEWRAMISLHNLPFTSLACDVELILSRTDSQIKLNLKINSSFYRFAFLLQLVDLKHTLWIGYNCSFIYNRVNPNNIRTCSKLLCNNVRPVGTSQILFASSNYDSSRD